MIGSTPIRDRIGHKFWAVIKPDKPRWAAPLDTDPIKDRYDMVSIDRPVRFGRERFPSELIDHVQHFEGLAIASRVELEGGCQFLCVSGSGLLAEGG